MSCLRAREVYFLCLAGGPASYFSSLGSYLPGRFKACIQVILLLDFGGVSGWLLGCESGECLRWCAVNTPRFLAPAVELSERTEWAKREEWGW